MRNAKILLPLLLLIPFVTFSQGVELGFSKGHARDVAALDFSPSGKFILSAGGAGDGLIKLWETKTGRLLKTWSLTEDMSGMGKYACDVAFLDEESFLAAVNGRPLLRLKITDDVSAKGQPFLMPGGGETPSVRAFRIHPKKKEILTLGDDKKLVSWNLKTGKPLVFNSLSDPGDAIISIDYSPDGQQIFTGTKKGKVFAWDMKKGIQKGNLTSHDKSALTLVSDHSANNDLVLLGGERSLKVWNIPSSEKTSINNVYSPGTGFVSPLRPAAFSADGALMAYGGIVQQPTLFIRDVKSGEIIHQLVDSTKMEKSEYVFSVRFSLDKTKVISGYGDGSILLWDVSSGKLLHRLEGKPREIKKARFTKNHRYAFIIHKDEKNITMMNGLKNQKYSLVGHGRDVLTAEFSPKDSFLFSSGADRSFIKWNYQTGEKVWHEKDIDHQITSLAISPDEKYALTTSGDKTVQLWDLEKRNKKNIGTFDRKINSVVFSSDGRYAMVGQHGDGVYIFNEKDNFESFEKISGQKDRFNNPVTFSSDGKYFLSLSCNHSVVELWNVEQQVVEDTFSIKGLAVVCGADVQPAFSPTNQSFLLPALNGAYIWDIETSSRRRLIGAADNIKTVDFTGAGRVAFAGGTDGSLVFWRAGMSTEPFVKVYQLNDNDWVAITPDGLFDASPNAFDKMYFTNQLESIDLEQLKDIYHEPDLLPILMRYKTGNLRKVVLDSLRMYPEVSTDFKKDSLLQITLTERTGGIGKVSVFVNGSEIIEDARSPKNKSKCDPINIWDYEQHFFLNEEELAKNVITIRAYNEGEWLKSPPIEIYPFGVKSKGSTNTKKYKGRKRKAEAGLHAIIIGTHDYKEKEGEKSMDLEYSAKDAITMSKALKNITDGYIKGPVNIIELTTEDANSENWPTKTSIKSAFDKVIKDSKAEDVLLLFMSGHGKTYSNDKSSDFYYLTSDCSSMDLAIEEVRTNYCIPADTLTKWMSKVPAKKRVVIMDACESGAGAAKFTNSKSLTSSQKKELEMLKDRSGMFVLASSEAGQQSYESLGFKQGLLTYSLMDGLVNTEGRVNVLELFQHAYDLIPDLAKGVSRIQSPVLTIPSEKIESFSIGWVDDPSLIPVSKTSDLIAPCLFIDAEKMNDHLYLSNLVDEQLREGVVSGRLGTMIPVNNPRNENAFAIRGLYEVRSGTVFLEGRVFKNTAPQGAVFKVQFPEGSSAQEKEQKIIEAVNRVLEGVE
ncbi:MAG: caspase family protein [Bacteroidota bacterium]